MYSKLDEFTVNYLRESGTTTGIKLYEALKLTFPSLTEVEFADLIWRLADHGQAELNESEHVGSFLQYLMGLERNAWYLASIATSLVAVLVAYVVPPDSPLVFLRWGFGLLFVLFIPGYVTVEALLPSASQLKGLERYAVSVGTTLVLDMLMGFSLNYTPWGIELTSVLVSLTVFSIVAANIALVRKFVASTR